MYIIEATLKNTTQVAKNHKILPLRKHYKSRFPQLSRNQLHERYSTDTMFLTVPSFGEILHAVKYLLDKKVITVRNDNKLSVCEALETFIVDVGAPFPIFRDNVKMETTKVWKRILRKFNNNLIKIVVKDRFKNSKRS